MSAESAIRADSLSKSYRSGGADLVVLDDLSLEVASGELLAVIGESGAGKSTLLHLLGGLDRPSKGKLYFGQRDLGALSDSQLADFRNKSLGFVWQSPSLLPEFSALENVMMPLLIRATEPEEAVAKARAKLDEVGLRSRETHRPGNCRVVSSSALRWLGLWLVIHEFCWPMSRPETWTIERAK